ncbi:molybdopterin-dependent oxidoreductase [Pseudorhodobacter sp. W20_MBD10_FR17]|uniref:molybdopterin-dependent oxidoreductase n=1 Tax=Pseudorhodobacter sp. W20_MBD10_FR17 TaxID=3240266 RepID=UPI003F9DCD70
MLRTVLRAATLMVALAAPSFGAELAVPKGDVLLTVSGNVGVSNANGTAVLDREMLEAMTPTTITTSTIWTEGVHSFQGVSLKDLVDALKIKGTNLRATAVNDYAIEIPLSDAVEGGAIIAYRIDGNEMSLREKGPLWVIYPYDSKADYRKEVIYSRSIWQLDRIEALQ